ncbi:MAG: DbpA RNA binding domain-containing protein [Spirochaetaceae bacterium]|nr:DbpA RNA binding domain-containing protein [Spirochaetaceae bacterium]
MASEEPADPRFKELLEEFERHIRDNADLERLKVIRRQIRKALPLSVRAYLPAYLLREAVGAGVPQAASGRARPAPAARTAKPPAAKPSSATAPSAKPGAAEAARRVPETPAPVKAAATDAPTPADTPDAPAGNSDSDMARLFVSVGRSRRVSRQMLTDLFVVKLDLPQDQIGEVRVLDNFSFIEVPAAVAQSAIDRITGETLNGRRVNVDFARSKKS